MDISGVDPVIIAMAASVIIWVILGWISSGIFCAVVAKSKRRGTVGWFVLGLIFGPIALLGAIGVMPLERKPLQRKPQERPEHAGQRACGKCGESPIHPDRSTCPKCGTELSRWESFGPKTTLVAPTEKS